MIELLIDSFRFSAAFLLILFGLLVFNFEKKSFRKNIFLVFIFTLISYLLAYYKDIQSFIVFFQITFFSAVSLPFFLWLASKSLFDEGFKWSKNYTILTIVLPILNFTLYTFNSIFFRTWYVHLKIIPYLITTFFILLSMYEAIKDKNNDLVSLRIKTRNIFIIFSSIIALMSIFFFFTENPMDLPNGFELLQIILIIIFILLFCYNQLLYKQLFLNKEINIEKNEIKTKESLIIEKLLNAFQEEGVFKQERITITLLSKLIGEKEYLVRKAINGEMGYTNFNTFLNHYRIKEALSILEEKNKEITFQEIAYLLGYQSVATFNRAFKKETGKTPTEYKKGVA